MYIGKYIYKYIYVYISIYIDTKRFQPTIPGPAELSLPARAALGAPGRSCRTRTPGGVAGAHGPLGDAMAPWGMMRLSGHPDSIVINVIKGYSC